MACSVAQPEAAHSASSLNGVALSSLKCAFANGLPGSFILK
jgi:hypothetical protein